MAKLKFQLKKNITTKERRKTLSIIDNGIIDGFNARVIIDMLKDTDLSYQRSNMLLDIRKRSAYFVTYRKYEEDIKEVINKTVRLKGESRENKLSFFDNIFEPIRKAKNLNSYQVSALIDKWRYETDNVLDLSKTSEEIEEIYRELFG